MDGHTPGPSSTEGKGSGRSRRLDGLANPPRRLYIVRRIAFFLEARPVLLVLDGTKGPGSRGWPQEAECKQRGCY